MNRPAIFFDRDNTLIVNDGYLGDPAGVKLMPGAAAAVARARALGFATVVVSNQSGVARGMFDESAVDAVNKKLDQMLLAADKNAVIDRHEFCPFHPEAIVEKYRRECERRKPGAGMLHDAAKALSLDLSRSWLIGDAPRDIQAGQAAGCRTILLSPPGIVGSPAAVAPMKTPPDKTAATLEDAMDFIQNAQVAHGSLASTAPHPRIETIAQQILEEMRVHRQHADFSDFSVSRLIAGIAQVVAVASAFLSYLYRGDGGAAQQMLLFAIFAQLLTIALLLMGRGSAQR